jgi:hypothetical protein
MDTAGWSSPIFGNIHQFLNKRLPDKCIGRGSFIAWLPRSLDLTQLDFFLLGYVKNIVWRKLQILELYNIA